MTGALPSLFGRHAVYATIAAVETFVDSHYQQQIDYLVATDDCPEDLLSLLMKCQADEQHHRDESAALAGDVSYVFLRFWCWTVGVGSSMAVALARRF
jgi:ubiquinone biosynthesis monooxygenase Coq7